MSHVLQRSRGAVVEGVLWLVLLAILVPAVQAGEHAALVETASAHETGRAIYNFRCYYCHGYSGDAKTLASRFLAPPPRDFTSVEPEYLTRADMIEAVRSGRDGTAMRGFGSVLGSEDIEAVVDFVRSEFMEHRRENTRYHTGANGWPQHRRYRAAYPFATGEIPTDTPIETLNEGQQVGWRLFMRSCVSCHDRASTLGAGLVWEREAVSYPRFGFGPRDLAAPPDALTAASPFAAHDNPPVLQGLSAEEAEGERLYQANCAFCHAADGSGRNWIGQFLNPNPRDLTDPDFIRGRTTQGLEQAISEGLPGTAMSAWKHVLAPEEIQAVAAYIARAFGRAEQNRQPALR